MAVANRNVVRTKYLYHAYEPTDGTELITILMDDKVFQIPPHEPYEMTTDSNGRVLDYPSFYCFQILQTYGPLYGLVEVEAEMTRTGITLDLEKAERQATDTLLLNRHRHLEQWATNQIAERVREGKPVLAPTGFVEESIKVLNIDLYAKYKLQPIGWDWRPDTTRPVNGAPSNLTALNDSPEVAALRQENAELKSRFDDLEGMLAELLAKK